MTDKKNPVRAARGCKNVLSRPARNSIAQRRKVQHLESLEADNFADGSEKNIFNDELQEEEDADSVFMHKRQKKRKVVKKIAADVKCYNSYLDEACLEAYHPSVPTYLTAVAAPSKFPKRHFCSICGYFGTYTCSACGSRFCSVKCESIHKDTRCLKFVVF